MDSLRLFQSSLDSVAKSMGNESFIELKKEFGDDNFNIMKEKGIYPYDYIDSFERLNETELPIIEKFYSKLNLSNISEKEYKRA